MRKCSLFAMGMTLVLIIISAGVNLQGAAQAGETLEYKVLAIDTSTWIVTAQEIETGNVVKFRMPPAMFKGQTFDAALDGVHPGQPFRASGPRNARLNQLVVESPLPNAVSGPKKQRMRAGKMAKMDIPFSSQPLGWEIMDVNAQQWVVSAKNRRTGRVIKFKVKPEGFIGFRFNANLQGVSKGNGFSIVAPNDAPFSNMCTLLE